TVMLPTVNNELKNMAQIEHSRHRSVVNFTVNLIAALSAYCFFPKKPMIEFDRVCTVEGTKQLTLF
ncbi:MAG: IS982 family transposase, partial [Bacteroidales bacterium]|nr:IS982 family transposase [Bacteroidales bacterium]